MCNIRLARIDKRTFETNRERDSVAFKWCWTRCRYEVIELLRRTQFSGWKSQTIIRHIGSNDIRKRKWILGGMY